MDISGGGGAVPSCSNTGGSGLDVSGADAVSSDQKISNGITRFHNYELYACFTNQYGATQPKDLGSAVAWNNPGAPQGWTYAITNHPTSGWVVNFVFDGSGPTGGEGDVPRNYVAQFADSTNGGYTSNYGYPQGLWGSAPGIRVRYCGNTFLSLCTSSSDVTASGAPYQLQVAPPSATCTVDPNGVMTGTPAALTGQGSGAAALYISSYTYVDAAGNSQTVTGQHVASVQLPPYSGDLRITGYEIDLPSGFGAPYRGDRIRQDSSCRPVPQPPAPPQQPDNPSTGG